MDLEWRDERYSSEGWVRLRAAERDWGHLGAFLEVVAILGVVWVCVGRGRRVLDRLMEGRWTLIMIIRCDALLPSINYWIKQINLQAHLQEYWP